MPTAKEILSMTIEELLFEDEMWDFMLRKMTIMEQGFSSACWIMPSTVAYLNGHKDGKYYVMSPPHRRYGTRAHQVAFKLWKGDLQTGYHVHHICKNTLCINPDHLEQLSPKDHAAKR